MSCVTVGDSDEEQKSPQKSHNATIQTPQVQINIHPTAHGHTNGHGHLSQYHKDNMATNGSNSSLNANNIKNNNTTRDVKPEIITTSYASQKKRLLAKAQSECLIGMKTEPGLEPVSVPGNRVVNETPKPNKNYNQRDAFQSVPAHHASLAVNYSGNGHNGPGCGGAGSSSSSASSNGRNGNSNAEYHAHYHPSQVPPPAHHHHHSGRNDVLRNQEVNHAQVIREAHSIKSTSAWGPNTLPPHSYRQELT